MHDVHSKHCCKHIYFNFEMCVLCTQYTALHAHGGADAYLCEEKNKINYKPFLSRRKLFSKPYDRHRPEHRA